LVDMLVDPSIVIRLSSKMADQLAETEVAGERGRLVADAFHETAVAGDHEGEVVLRVGAEAGTQVLLGDRHPDGVGEALAERAGGDLDAEGVAGLGVAGGDGLPLAEVAQVVELEAVAAQVQQGVLQDRGVPVGEDETVTVRPARIGGVVLHDPAVEHVSERRQCHRCALVAAVGGEWAVHRHPPDERDGELVLFCCQRHAGEGTRTRSSVTQRHRLSRCQSTGGSKVKGTRCHAPWSTRQWATIWP
jgi:hypothetical protein